VFGRTFLFSILFVVLISTSAFALDPLFAAATYREEIETYTAQYLPNVSSGLIAGQIHQESKWNKEAVSRSGAGGLLQVMPATARDIAISCQIPGFDRFNPQHALKGGICYDAQVRKWVGTFSSRTDQNMAMLAAYNGGAGYIIKQRRAAVAAGLDKGVWKNVVKWCGLYRSRPSCDENNGYAPSIMKWQKLYFSSW
jgi:soluble lytic murein transglycosylase-like protein